MILLLFWHKHDLTIFSAPVNIGKLYALCLSPSVVYIHSVFFFLTLFLACQCSLRSQGLFDMQQECWMCSIIPGLNDY